MEYEEILYDVDDGIATVKFNRPHAMNAGTVQTYRELEDAFRRAGEVQGCSRCRAHGRGPRLLLG